MSSNDDELKKNMLEKLNRGENLGFGWRRKLQWLNQNGSIDDDQLEYYTKLHIKSKEDANSKLAEKHAKIIADSRPIPCSQCGDVINAGTYGFIYNSKNSEFNIIKGSILGHSITTGCPPDFEREIINYQKIYPIFQEIKSRNIVSLLDVKNKFIENRRCYYEMDKIFPYVIDESLMQKIQRDIHQVSISTDEFYLFDEINFALESEGKTNYSENDKYFLNLFLKMNTIIMLTPGFNKDYFSTGGNKYSNWIELGENKIKMLFSLLGISYEQYCASLILLLQSTLKKNIILTDVEFILGSIKTDQGFRNGIFMIDFDKVVEKTSPVTPFDVRNLLSQDMFPDVVRSSILGSVYQKKYLKYKKKYLNLKNKITKYN